MLYNIISCDVVLAVNGINKLPVIYIKPDNKFNQFAKYNTTVDLVISETNTVYDWQDITGVINPSNASITLQALWYGYPDASNLGQVDLKIEYL